MGLANPIRDDLRAAGLLPDALPDYSTVNSRGEGADATVDRRTADLEPADVGFLQDGGWTAVSIKGDGGGGGLTSHRGVLHPDEYVDYEALVAGVELELSFSFDEVHSVYRQGPLSTAQRELRGQIDARLLALSRSGAEVTLLARILGWKLDETERDGGASCKRMRLALKRAREAEAA